MTRARPGTISIKIRITELAAQAIVDQADYYLVQQDKLLAGRWEDAVKQAIESLLKMPERGSLCCFDAARLSSLRRIPVPGFQQHLVFYQYMRELRIVRIVHVIHGARDIETILAGLG